MAGKGRKPGPCAQTVRSPADPASSCWGSRSQCRTCALGLYTPRDEGAGAYTCSCQSRAELLPGWLSPALPACNVGAQKPSKVKKSPQAKKLKKAFGSGPACTRGDMGGGADSARCGHCDVLGGGRGQGSPPLAQKLKQVDPKG